MQPASSRVFDSRQPADAYAAPRLQLVRDAAPRPDPGRESRSPARLAADRQLVRGLWTVEPEPGLPDVVEWGGMLAVAMMQAVLAQRPVGQLNRWLSEAVLADVARHQRRRLAHGGPVERVTLGLVRVGHPSAESAEVAALLQVGRRPLAAAFRLDAVNQRWCCTALDLGPGAGGVRASGCV